MNKMKNIFNRKFNKLQPVDTNAVVVSSDQQHSAPKVLRIFPKSSFLLIILSIVIITVQTSCKKLVESDPPTTQVTQPTVFASDASAIGVFSILYGRMGSVSLGGFMVGQGGMPYLTELSADELVSFGNAQNFYANNIIITSTYGSGLDGAWSNLYNNIYTCNAGIEQMNKTNTLSPAVKTQLLGEAKFFRALNFFYLTNLFGDVPLTLTTDPNVNNTLARTLQKDVYNQIIADLTEAKGLLSVNFLDGTLLNTTTERVRPTKWAAEALLARVYLYTKNYSLAEQASTDVINNTALFGPLPTLSNVFLKNSVEAIWQIQPTQQGYNTEEGAFMILSSGNMNSGYLSSFLLNNVETGDKRFVDGNWVNSFSLSGSGTVKYMYKYKVAVSPGVTSPSAMTEYFMMLRLGEQYLIRAEARAQNSNIAGSQADLNAIRNRAGLGNTTANDQTSLLNAVLKERQMELFCEAGHRWFDLKRTGTIDNVMSIVTPQKSGGLPWKPYQALFPIPVGDILKNQNLTQNAGY